MLSLEGTQDIIAYDDTKQAGIEHALSILGKDHRISSSVIQALEEVVSMWKKNATTDEVCSHEGSEQEDSKRMHSEEEGSGEVPSSPLPDTAHPDSKANIQNRRFKPPSSKMLQLSAEDACEIYNMRPRNSKERRGSMVQCKTIAPKYGVSAKTIRDIWRGRTWILATKHLWSEEEIAERGDGDDASRPANSGIKSEIVDKSQTDRIYAPSNFNPVSNFSFCALTAITPASMQSLFATKVES
jgi:hypothetical protein